MIFFSSFHIVDIFCKHLKAQEKIRTYGKSIKSDSIKIFSYFLIASKPLRLPFIMKTVNDNDVICLNERSVHKFELMFAHII